MNKSKFKLLLPLICALAAAPALSGCGGGGGVDETGSVNAPVSGPQIFNSTGAFVTTIKSGATPALEFSDNRMPNTVSVSYTGPLTGPATATREGTTFFLPVTALTVTTTTPATITVTDGRETDTSTLQITP